MIGHDKLTVRFIHDQCHHVASNLKSLGNPRGSEAQRVLYAACDRVIELCRTEDPYDVSCVELQREMRNAVIAFHRLEGDLATSIMSYLQQVAEDC